MIDDGNDGVVVGNNWIQFQNVTDHGTGRKDDPFQYTGGMHQANSLIFCIKMVALL